jgi:hypothetical protein
MTAMSPLRRRMIEDMTSELRQAAWPDKRPRKPESIMMMLNRLERRLAPYGFAIAKIGAGGEDRIYRLVPPRTRTRKGSCLG